MVLAATGTTDPALGRRVGRGGTSLRDVVHSYRPTRGTGRSAPPHHRPVKVSAYQATLEDWDDYLAGWRSLWSDGLGAAPYPPDRERILLAKMIPELRESDFLSGRAVEKVS